MRLVVLTHLLTPPIWGHIYHEEKLMECPRCSGRMYLVDTHIQLYSCYECAIEIQLEEYLDPNVCENIDPNQYENEDDQ